MQNKQIICVWSAWIFDNDAMDYIQDGHSIQKQLFLTMLLSVLCILIYTDNQSIILV